MTIYKKEDDEKILKQRLSADVYRFLGKEPKILDYLFDHLSVVGKLKIQVNQLQLSDNSICVLSICKAFEGILYLLAREKTWFDRFNNGRIPKSIRGFYVTNRKKIEQDLDIQCKDLLDYQKQYIKDKLFSTVQDFEERHLAVHYCSMLEAGEMDNYDAILTKIRELIRMFIDNKLISI